MNLATVNQHLRQRQARRQGLGFAPLEWGWSSEYGDGGGYYGDYDTYQYSDYGGGWGGEILYDGGGYANPPDGYAWDWNSGFITPDIPYDIGVDPPGIDWNNFYPEFGWYDDPYQTPGINPDSNYQWDGSVWYDPTTGNYYDEWGNFYDVYERDYTPDSGDVIRSTTTEYGTPDFQAIYNTNLAALEQSILGELNAHSGSNAEADLRALYDTMMADHEVQSILDELNALPNSLPNQPRRNALLDKVKKTAQDLLKTATAGAGASGGASSGGAAAASKPPTAAPKPDGTCSAGYAKHPTTGVCTLIPPKPSAEKKFVADADG